MSGLSRRGGNNGVPLDRRFLAVHNRFSGCIREARMSEPTVIKINDTAQLPAVPLFCSTGHKTPPTLSGWRPPRTTASRLKRCTASKVRRCLATKSRGYFGMRRGPKCLASALKVNGCICAGLSCSKAMHRAKKSQRHELLTGSTARIASSAENTHIRKVGRNDCTANRYSMAGNWFSHFAPSWLW